MRVLLDECIDRRLVSHEVRTVPQMGWPAIENGKLLTLAAQSLTFLSQLIETLLFNRTYRVSTWQLWSFAPTNRLEDLRALVPKLLQALPTAKRGEAIRVST